MAISTERKTNLDDLKTLLEAITVANGYQSTVAEVKRGIHYVGDMPNRPGLCFWNDKGPKKDLAGEQCERVLHVWIWGYVDIQPGDYDALDAIVSDVEKCLNTSLESWSSSVTESKVIDTTYYEGGVSDPIGIFEMEAEITYEYDRASP